MEKSSTDGPCQTDKDLDANCHVSEKSGNKPVENVMVPTKKAIITLLERLAIEKKSAKTPEKILIIDKDISYIMDMIGRY